MRTILTNLAIALISVFATLLLGELVIRLVEPQLLYRFPKDMYVNDPVLDYRMAPNFEGVARTPEYEMSIRTNSDGFRDTREVGSRPAGTRRILAIGDSFTMGVGVEEENAWLRLIETSLSKSAVGPVEIINAGVPAYNTRQEVDLLRELGPRYEPDVVLLGLFVGNDIQDNHRDLPLHVKDGYLQKEGQPQGLLPLRLRIFLQTRSHLYTFLWPIFRALTDPNFAEQQANRGKAYARMYARDESEDLLGLYESTEQKLREFGEICGANGYRGVVIIIPDQYQVNSELWRNIMTGAGLDPNDYDPARPDRYFKAVSEAQGLAVIDLLPAFQGAETDEPLYFRLDGHWTIAGNELAAASVTEALEKILARSNSRGISTQSP